MAEERTLCEAVKMKPRLVERPQDLKGRCQNHGMSPKGTADRDWNRHRREKCAADSKAGRTESSKHPNTIQEVRDLEFVQLVSSLALVQFFLTVMYIRCHCMLEVLICLLILYGATIKRFTRV